MERGWITPDNRAEADPTATRSPDLWLNLESRDRGREIESRSNDKLSGFDGWLTQKVAKARNHRVVKVQSHNLLYETHVARHA